REPHGERRAAHGLRRSRGRRRAGTAGPTGDRDGGVPRAAARDPPRRRHEAARSQRRTAGAGCRAGRRRPRDHRDLRCRGRTGGTAVSAGRRILTRGPPGRRHRIRLGEPVDLRRAARRSHARRRLRRGQRAGRSAFARHRDPGARGTARWGRRRRQDRARCDRRDTGVPHRERIVEPGRPGRCRSRRGRYGCDRVRRQAIDARPCRLGRRAPRRPQGPGPGRCAALPRRPRPPSPLSLCLTPPPHPVTTQEDAMSRTARSLPSRRSMLYAGFGVFTLPTALAACGTTEEGADPAAPVDGGGGGGGDASGAVVTVPKLTGIPWFNRMEQGVELYAEDTGENAYYQGSAEADAAAQVRVIEDLIASGVAALCVTPFQPDAVEQVLAKAMDADIVVITHEAPTIENADYDIEAFKNDEYGINLMDELAKAMGEEGEY